MRTLFLAGVAALGLAACTAQQPQQQAAAPAATPPVDCDAMPQPLASGAAVMSTSGTPLRPPTQGCEAMPTGPRPGQTAASGQTTLPVGGCEALPTDPSGGCTAVPVGTGRAALPARPAAR